MDFREIRLALGARLGTWIENAGFALKGWLMDGCRHRRLGWPQAGEQSCLDCSACWSYDWDAMRRGGRLPITAAVARPRFTVVRPSAMAVAAASSPQHRRAA
jgi:hypothetical protein